MLHAAGVLIGEDNDPMLEAVDVAGSRTGSERLSRGKEGPAQPLSPIRMEVGMEVVVP